MAHRVRPLLAAALLAAALTGCGAATTGAPAADPTPAVTPTAAPAAPATAAPLPASEPVRVTIPAAGVDTSPVLRLGLAADGTVEVPSVADADKIGWYTKGVTPGETGPAVLIGHFDTARGPAVLRDVSRVRAGEEITVARADGTTAVFRVRELEQVGKDRFPTAKVYGDTTRPELRVITCGGEITDGHRPDNIILYADLVG
ncbi:class F sortase [Streptomyces erythrochromogenes]|uniref:class F sortase n=1 Tax=Streptomyces erythrochromogenes TaxID=285574 RepID=UPI0036C8DDBF